MSMKSLERVRQGSGRQIDWEKRKLIVRVARDLFYQRGYAAVTLKDVAAAANVSRVTLYKHFKDKQALFGEAIRSEVMAVDTAFLAKLGAGDSVTDVLTAFGQSLLTIGMRDDVIASDRLFAFEAGRDPALGHTFYDNGPAPVLAALGALIEALQSQGVLAKAVPAEAAEDLISLWLGVRHLEMRFAVKPAPDEAEIAARVKRGVENFLKIYGASSSLRDPRHR